MGVKVCSTREHISTCLHVLTCLHMSTATYPELRCRNKSEEPFLQSWPCTFVDTGVGLRSPPRLEAPLLCKAGSGCTEPGQENVLWLVWRAGSWRKRVLKKERRPFTGKLCSIRITLASRRLLLGSRWMLRGCGSPQAHLRGDTTRGAIDPVRIQGHLWGSPFSSLIMPPHFLPSIPYPSRRLQPKSRLQTHVWLSSSPPSNLCSDISFSIATPLGLPLWLS